jgi:cytochrome c oxidase subunit 4
MNSQHHSVHGHHEKSHKAEYLIVFLVLGILTIIELYIPGLKNVDQVSKTVSLIGLALGKAFLVAYYYMHLKQETKWLKIIALIPLSAALYATVLIIESVYR